MNVEPDFCATLPASLAPAWGRLLEHSQRPTFQYEFDYMAAWTELLRRDWEPLILLAKEDGALRGIVPLMYRDEKRRGVLPYRRIRFLGSEMTDFSVILARPEDTAAVVHASMTWLFKGGFRWERLILDDLAEGNLYRAADLYVSVSNVEAFSLAALDALACGIPVLVTSRHGERDAIIEGETGFVLSDETPQALAERLGVLVDDRAGLRSRKETIRSSVSRLTWDNAAEQLTDVCLPLV